MTTSATATPATPTTPSPAAVATTPVTPPPPGRLAVLTGLAVAAGSIPVPFVPDRVVRLVRGAIAHEVLARHGLSLTSDARAVLADPDAEQGPRVLARKAAELVSRSLLRKLGRLGVLASALRGAEVYALGHLLERYVVEVRRDPAVRVHEAEARRVRRAIDAAVLHAFSPSLRPRELTVQSGVEDLRDEFTRWVDTLLLTGAALPSYLERRLESAFDEVVARSPGLGDG